MSPSLSSADASYLFMKMNGAGNDFLVVFDRDGSFPRDDAAIVARMCSPHDGLGTEGMLVLTPSSVEVAFDDLDAAPAAPAFHMHFRNPDGSHASMCGNGARCAAFAAVHWKFASPCMHFTTDAYEVHAHVAPHEEDAVHGLVTIEIPAPADAPQAVNAGSPRRTFLSLNTGVPHAVAFVESENALAALDVDAEGRAARYDAVFAPKGTNVDFAAPVAGASDTFQLRTYERGVEAETAACGTGVIATALAALATGHAHGDAVSVRVAHGDTLTVRPDHTHGTVALTGPAVIVCEGTLRLDSFLPA